MGRCREQNEVARRQCREVFQKFVELVLVAGYAGGGRRAVRLVHDHEVGAMLDEIVALPVALHEINADDLDRVVAEDAARAGGDPTPSDADIKVTRDLIRAGQLLKIDVVDHVIIGRATAARAKDYASLRELGYFF